MNKEPVAGTDRKEREKEGDLSVSVLRRAGGKQESGGTRILEAYSVQDLFHWFNMVFGGAGTGF